MNPEQKEAAFNAIVGNEPEPEPVDNQVITSQERPDQTARIKVSITRHYGSISVELGAEINVLAWHPEDFNRAYSDLYDHVLEQHKIAAGRLASSSQKLQSPNGSSPAAAHTSASGEAWDKTINVDCIVVEFKSNKRYYSIKGGKWTKFGIRLWIDPKTIEDVKDEIKFTDLPIGENTPPIPMMAEIDFEGDIPKKIKRLFRATQDSQVPF